MSRANWKGPYVNERDLQTLKKLKNNYDQIMVSRNTEILPRFIEQTFKIYNGQKYNEVTVTEDMVGHKFGEFAFTRTQSGFKKKKSKK